MTSEDLHTDRGWSIRSFEVREEAHADEVGILKAAKAVLSGADRKHPPLHLKASVVMSRNYHLQ